MKKLKIYSLVLLLFAGFTFVSCEEDSDELTGGAELGGELILKKEAIGYVVGNGVNTNYDNEFTIFQGTEKVESIDIYRTFTTKNEEGEPIVSNKVLLRTVTLPAVDQHEVLPFSVTYNQLIQGLILEGSPVTSDDTQLNIGDYFTLTFVSHLNTGLVHENAHQTKISVGTRFAGVYKVIQGEYWRINVYRPDVTWVGETRIIESVDATTYKFLNYAGPFGPPTDNSHYFTVDGSDVVRTPVSYNGAGQFLNTGRVINCEETPLEMTHACGYAGPQNTIVRDDVNGKDRIYRSYGYNTTGPREIYEVLEKVVD
jgi:hypothetical protein